MIPTSEFPEVSKLLQIRPPDRLFHYTSPGGLIGIAQSKEIWATNVRYLNDTKELKHAAEVSRNFIANFSNKSKLNKTEERFLATLSQYAGNSSSDIYVVSLTEKRDLLSQWRAYCPSTGGFSLGMSSDHLQKVALEQRFFLCPAVYDHQTQYRLMGEIILKHIQQLGAELTEKQADDAAITCARDISKYGAILKHHSFKEEAEWRLISESQGVNSPHLSYREGMGTIIPYIKLSLSTPSFPDINRHMQPDSLLVVVGPTADYSAASFATQSLGHNCFPPGWAMGRSECPYRG
ncbi:MAG: DUF2971 domain-containing protein [Pseudomonadales bacterium]